MKRAASAFVVGLLFGAGLAASQMMNPAKVIGFLDFTGRWDPTLAVVMIGALAASAPGFALARRRSRSLLGESMRIPTRRDVTARLVAGAAIFGLGWGIAGFCPGPALSALGTGQPRVFLFVAAMIGGMLLSRAMPGERAPEAARTST
jgi:uncharacterized membrane protein YedE/YeeE